MPQLPRHVTRMKTVCTMREASPEGDADGSRSRSRALGAWAVRARSALVCSTGQPIDSSSGLSVQSQMPCWVEIVPEFLLSNFLLIIFAFKKVGPGEKDANVASVTGERGS